MNGRSRALTISACIHCGREVPTPGVRFCCLGCEAVYRLTHQEESDLLHVEDSRQVATDYLDDPEFLKSYSWQDSAGRWMNFHLEGVHCASCVWVTEKVPELVNHVLSVRLNLGTSIANVCIDPNAGSFSSVARQFLKLGYRPVPVALESESDLESREDRMFLIRTGVAAACAGNIMLLAISLYAGAEGKLASEFRWISFLLYLPVLFFSAEPFLKSAWNAIRARELSIDVPIVFGILLGSAVSVINLFTGYEDVYFDSLASLVFLLLGSRYLLKRVQQTAFKSTQLLKFLIPEKVWKWNSSSNKFEKTDIQEIANGDRIQIPTHEKIPADGFIVEGQGFIDNSLLTGESIPITVQKGDSVFAGTVNGDSPFTMQVMEVNRSTRLGKILRSTEQTLLGKARLTAFTDRVSKYFVLAVMILTLGVLITGLFGHWHQSLNRALAVAIVTCPCTFALGTPLALSMVLGRLARLGILFKTPDLIEKLSQIQRVYFDKTGTLTTAQPKVTHWQIEGNSSFQIEASVILYALELQSKHPAARAILQHLEKKVDVSNLPTVSNIVEKLGKGISADCGGAHFEIGEGRIKRNGIEIGNFTIEDTARSEAGHAIDALKKYGITPYILSGDRQEIAQKIAHEIGIRKDHVFANSSPETKQEILKQAPPSLMVGDGSNDTIALAQAHVGMAVQEGTEISKSVADVCLRIPDLRSIPKIISICKESLKVIHRNFAFALIYNLIAAVAAVAGKIDPLFAALLMPASAFTVFLSTIYGTRKMRRSFQEIGTL